MNYKYESVKGYKKEHERLTIIYTYIYSMCFDFIVLSLAAWRLYDRRGHSQISKLLFHDGLAYFAVA